jgi:HEPN domain-containing protein
MANVKLTRSDFKQLAKIRLKEAKALLDTGNYDGAYYLLGYTIECGLKACIAKQTKKYDFPDKDIVNDSYCHNLKQLLGLTELVLLINDDRKRNNKLEVNWSTVIAWNESSRYSTHSELDAKSLYSAITDKQNGVLIWIKKYW